MAEKDVVIQNYSQTEVTYQSVPKVWLKSAESTEENTVLVPFSYGEAIENVPISLDFSAGDQTIAAPEGYLVKSGVIEKPFDLVAENVRRGKVIAGIEGDFIGDTEEISVSGDDDLTFAGGDDFVVEPSSAEKVISKVTISPPSELIPANIAKGVTIAGVEGTHEGGGGGYAELNIAFGDTAPSDTSKLWIQGDAPTDLLVSSVPFSDAPNTIETLATTLPTAAGRVGTVVVGEKVYLFGGDIGNNGLNTINVFDTTTNTIETLSTTLKYPTRSFGIAAKDNKVYLFGGTPTNGTGGWTNEIETFDINTETVETLTTTLPYQTRNMATAIVGTKVYLFGGYQYSGATGSGYLNTINVFDTETNAIETLSATLPTAAENIMAIAHETKIYLFGGYGGSIMNTICVFDTTTNTIKTLSKTLPVTMYGAGCAIINKKIYLCGGYTTGSAKLDTIYAFDVETESVSKLSTTIPTATYYITAAALGTKIYLFGGYANDMVNTIYEFTVISKLDAGAVRVVTTGDKRLFRFLPNMEAYIYRVYRGNHDGVAEIADSYLYTDGEWTNIVPIPAHSWRVETVSGAKYGFALSGDYYVSQNKGVSSSYALCKVVIDTNVGCKAIFNCINYAEARYDYGILSTVDNTLSLSNTADSANVHKKFSNSTDSKETVQTVEYEIPEGTHFIYVKFIKDGSGNSNNDTLQFNVTLENI